MSKKEAEKERRGQVQARGSLTRKVCYLWPDELKALESEAKLKEVSESEVMRRALRSYLEL